MGKKDLIKNAYQIDKEGLFKSIFCYKRGSKNCGICDSCQNRKKAFKEMEILDKTEYLA